MGKWQYGVVLDAGSSGTRVYVYRWLKDKSARQAAVAFELKSLPAIETHPKWTKKIRPGVSTFGDTPALIGPDHLKPLFEHALKVVPSAAVQETPIFLLATAGIRLLSDVQRSELLANICSYAQNTTRFLLPDCSLHIQAIPGEIEGLYGWLAANYLLGGFDAPTEHDHGKGHHTYGFLDMGGASAQIAFVPNATETRKHANDLKLVRLRNIDGSENEYNVFSTTWLRFGVNEARKRYLEALLLAAGNDRTGEIPDPCLPGGIKMSLSDSLLSVSTSDSPMRYLIGTGKFEECLKATFPLLDKDAPCEDQPCLLHGIHTPAIDFEVNHFVGVSVYWHATHEIFEMSHKEAAYDLKTYQQRANKFCQQDWAAIQTGVDNDKWGKKVDEQSAYEACFKASWLINMLHYGIGVPREGLEANNTSGHNENKHIIPESPPTTFLEPFQAINKIKHTEVSWTLGKMVLYASSQMSSVGENSLPVGFGSNDSAVLDDFQVPGVIGHQPIATNTTDSPADNKTISEKIHSTLFVSDSRRRIPGLLLLLLVVLVAMFYLCGRDRRSKMYRLVLGSSGKKRRSGPSDRSIFSFRRRPGPSYERVLEDGGTLGDPRSYELDDVDSDESEQGHAKTAGWVSPRRKQPVGKNTLDAMDRSGLVVRTESRERLALQAGRKSRTGSPARLKGGLKSFVEQ